MRTNTFYHIYNRGNNSETIFRAPEDYLDFLSLTRRYILPSIRIYAWALLPNHYHFLAKIRTDSEQNEYFLRNAGATELTKPFKVLNPSRGIANACSTYAQSFNQTYHRTGSLFQDGFKRKEVAKYEYARRLANYIHFNPVKHRIARNAEVYPWSSLSAYFSDSRCEHLGAHVRDLFIDSDDYQKYWNESSKIERNSSDFRESFDDD